MYRHYYLIQLRQIITFKSKRTADEQDKRTRRPVQKLICTSPRAASATRATFPHHFSSSLFSNMPRARRLDWINWRPSAARQVILDDLAEGRLPLDDDVVTAEEAWEEMYFVLPEFQNVIFSQFKARLKDHRKQVRRRTNAVDLFLIAFRHDQELQRQGYLAGGGRYDRHGQPIFDRSTAKPLLKQDVIDELHKEMTPEELHDSRDEFKEWPLETFKRRLRQEIATQKWHYYLEWKRAKKLVKRGKRDEDPGVDSEEEEDHGGTDEEMEDEEMEDEEEEMAG